MKNQLAQAHPFARLTSRLVIPALFAAILLVAPFQAALAQTAPNLGAADSFAALSGGPAVGAVTLTNSTVIGDVGVVLPGTIVKDALSTISGDEDPNAVGPYSDFLDAYNELADVECGTTLLTGNLAGLVLTPGVYCVEAASTTTGGVLTLAGSSADEWIFKIGTSEIIGLGALTGTNFTVVMSSGETCNNNVYWWVFEAATLTDSVFIGTILAGKDITVTGGSLDGQALAGGAGTTEVPAGAVTLTGAEVSVCGSTTPPPPPPILHPAIKVTGGGQIAVPDPNSTGRASFGFNAQPDKMGGAKGHFNYVNHETGLHVNGPVDYIRVIAIYPDGSPKTVLFSGTWTGGAFFVTVEDHGEPGWDDEFGVTVTGAQPDEVTSQRTISRGNIQFHENPPMMINKGKGK